MDPNPIEAISHVSLLQSQKVNEFSMIWSVLWFHNKREPYIVFRDESC